MQLKLKFFYIKMKDIKLTSKKKEASRKKGENYNGQPACA